MTRRLALPLLTLALLLALPAQAQFGVVWNGGTAPTACPGWPLLGMDTSTGQLFGCGSTGGPVQAVTPTSTTVMTNKTLTAPIITTPTITTPTISSTYLLTEANGASRTCGIASEEVTLATGAATSDSTANLLPANSIIQAVAGRVTTTITASCTGWELGDATTAARFTANDTTLTAGETKVGLAAMQGGISTDAAGPVQIAAAKVRITCAGGNPGAGKIRVSVFYCSYTAPTS